MRPHSLEESEVLLVLNMNFQCQRPEAQRNENISVITGYTVDLTITYIKYKYIWNYEIDKYEECILSSYETVMMLSFCFNLRS